MSINIMQGALAAAIMESRGASKDQVVSGAILSAFLPGVLGLAIPLLMPSDGQQDSGGPAAPAGPGTPPDGGSKSPTGEVQPPTATGH